MKPSEVSSMHIEHTNIVLRAEGGCVGGKDSVTPPHQPKHSWGAPTIPTWWY